MFEEERARVSSILESEKKDADLVFAVVTDSHLDDYEEETLANIKAVDHRARFDPKRQAGSVEAELWDVLLLKPSERKLYAFRFGAGNDRVLQY